MSSVPSGRTNQYDFRSQATTDGSDFKGERLTVQFARGPRRKENLPGGPPDRPTAPRPRRTMFRMQISGLPETSWQVSSPSSSPPGYLGPHFPWPSLCLNVYFPPVCGTLLGHGS